MLLHDSLFEPRHRLPWLHCELLPQLPPQTRCRHSSAPIHTYITCVFWWWCFFTTRVCVGLFTMWCSVGQDSDRMLRTGVVFPTRSSFMQKTCPVNGEKDVLCLSCSVLSNPLLGFLPKYAKFHFMAQCAAEFCLCWEDRLPRPQLCHRLLLLPALGDFPHMWLQPASLQSLM